MRIAVVNDLSLAVEAIRRVLAADGRHQVAWVARDGAEAVEKCKRDTPDLILMDLIMPGLNGIEATRQIMAGSPCPILVVTATIDGNVNQVFEALGAGALDVVQTPVLGAISSAGSTVLLEKIGILGKQITSLNRSQKLPPISGHKDSATGKRDQLLAIGASAGGPMALVEVLSTLPANFPAAVVIIQHVDAQFAPGLVEWLNQHSRMPVRLAQERDKLTMGTVWMASTSDHLVLIDQCTLGYTPKPIDYVYRPSVDVFFQSVEKYWRGRVVGVLLTGMGRDGAKGLKILREAGHHTIAQDRDSSAVYGMPKAAAALNAAVDILPLNQIGPALRKIFIPHSLERCGDL